MSCTIDQLINQNEIISRHFVKYENDRISRLQRAQYTIPREKILRVISKYIIRVAHFQNQENIDSRAKKKAKDLYWFWQAKHREYTGKLLAVDA